MNTRWMVALASALGILIAVSGRPFTIWSGALLAISLAGSLLAHLID